MQTLISVLNKVTEAQLKSLIARYYKFCSHVHSKAFAEWRLKIKELKEGGFIDANDGYYYPYLKTRTVLSLDSIHFKADWLTSPLKRLQTKLTSILSKKY